MRACSRLLKCIEYFLKRQCRIRSLEENITKYLHIFIYIFVSFLRFIKQDLIFKICIYFVTLSSKHRILYRCHNQALKNSWSRKRIDQCYKKIQKIPINWIIRQFEKSKGLLTTRKVLRRLNQECIGRSSSGAYRTYHCSLNWWGVVLLHLRRFR